MAAGWKVLALVALVTVAAACGGKSYNSAKGSTTTVASLLPTAAPSSVPADSAPTTPTTPTTTGGTQNTLRIAATTTADAKSARTFITVALSGFGRTASVLAASGAIDFALGARMTLRAANGDRTEERVVNGIIYFQLGKRVGPNSWIAFDPKKTRLPGLNALDLSHAQGDPGQYLTFVSAATNDYTRVGTEVVRGARTTHYRGAVDVAKALVDQSVPKTVRELLAISVPRFRQALIPINVWIDAQGRVRKIRTVRSLANYVGPGVSGSSAVTVEFFGFGTQVNVSAPPANEVVGG
jgi:hypothetical protein